MEDDENWRSELDIGGLSLIDVSTEDDSLLFSSFLDSTSFEFSDTDKEEKCLSLFGDAHNCDEEIMVSTLEGKEELLHPHESPEPQEMMKIGKYNLRKSLAWDKAFFTNEGVLEPDELSSMIESNHIGERKFLPSIQEDVNRSTESISTLQSDCTVETSQEFVLFEDVRASIQRSAISSDAVTPGKSKKLGITEAASSPTPKLVDIGFQEKMKPNGSRKKPSIRAQGLGKATKQPVAAKEQNTSISRPANGLSIIKRASVDAKKAKQEENPSLAWGKEPLAPISRSTRSIVSKPVVPLKSVLRSSIASKNEMTSSCSSIESYASASSSSSLTNSSLDSVKQKKAQSLKIASHSLANGALAASRNISQPKVPPLSVSRTYKFNLSSNVSPVSSSVDWSSESSGASTPNKMSKGIQKTLPVDETTQTLLKPTASTVQEEQGAKRSASLKKPTGLRVPSPKIGYFDGARTPTGSRTSPVSGMAKHGARSPNESTTASKTKSAKSPRLIVSKSPRLIVSKSPRLIVSASGSSLKLTNKMHSKVNAEEEDNIAR